MARLEQIDTDLAAAMRNMPCPEFSSQPWVEGPALAQRRIALVSTAGLHRSDDRPFCIPSATTPAMPADYRIIPSQCTANDLVMSHVSANFDRTGFQQDWNVVFPLDRLRELAQAGTIGSLADFHYSFMGAANTAMISRGKYSVRTYSCHARIRRRLRTEKPGVVCKQHPPLRKKAALEQCHEYPEYTAAKCSPEQSPRAG